MPLPVVLMWVALIAGIVLTSATNVMYYRRTRDRQIWRRVWLRRDVLTRSEYLLNRIGFWIMVVSVIGIGIGWR